MALEKFHYTIGDVEVTLPHLGNLPAGIARKSRKLDDGEKLWLIFETLFAEGSPELDALDSLDTEGLGEFMEAWTGHAGVGLGESTPS